MFPFLPGWVHQPGLPYPTRYVSPGDLATLPSSPEAWAVWDLHSTVILGVLFLAVLYGLLAGPLRVRWLGRAGLSPSLRPHPWQIVSYGCALLTLVVSLNGPIHHLSDYYLFTAHMTQHLLLTQVFPPLFLLGLPAWMMAPLLRPWGVGAVLRLLTRPLSAFLLYNGVVVFWHLPPYYDWTMRDHNVHIVEHLTFLCSAVIAWWPVCGGGPELPRPSYLLQILYLFLMTVAMKITGAVIGLQTTLVYTFYAESPRVLPLSPLGDQKLGGLLMWVFGDWPLWLAMGVIFWRWSRRDKLNGPGSLERGPLPQSS